MEKRMEKEVLEVRWSKGPFVPPDHGILHLEDMLRKGGSHFPGAMQACERTQSSTLLQLPSCTWGISLTSHKCSHWQ